MRVDHLIKAKQIGGAERHLLMLLPALAARKIDVRLLVLVEPDSPMDDYVREARDRDILTEVIPIKGSLDVVTINRVREVLSKRKPDILHTHLIHADTFGLAAAKLAGVKHVITSRHNDDDFRNGTAVRLANRLLWSAYDACIAISDALRVFVTETEGAPEDLVHVVRYGIEHESISDEAVSAARVALREELDLAPETLLAGMACRLVEQKGVTYALQAMEMLRASHPDVHLVIAGDGDLMHELKHEAADREVAARVHFLGWRRDVPQVMAGLDLFLMPSLWEGFGLVALEAMSKRVPVIASEVSALPEVIANQETGLLIPPKSAQSLADAMTSLLNDRALRQHMGLVAEDRVESHFSVSRMADETVAVYKKLLPDGPSTTGKVKRKVSIN